MAENQEDRSTEDLSDEASPYRIEEMRQVELAEVPVGWRPWAFWAFEVELPDDVGVPPWSRPGAHKPYAERDTDVRRRQQRLGVRPLDSRGGDRTLGHDVPNE